MSATGRLRGQAPVESRQWCTMSVKNSLSASLIVSVMVVACIAAGCTGHPPGPDLNASQYYGENGGGFEVHFIDVGQGDSVLLKTAGKVVLIDAGDRDAGYQVVDYLVRQNVTVIDLLVATHPHSDHIGGMQDVLRNFQVREVLDSGIPYNTTTSEAFLETVEWKKIPVRKAVRGQEIEWAPGVMLRVLSPPENPPADAANDNSVVIQTGYGRIGFLFMADARLETEKDLLALHVPLGNQVLKVSHHGSSDATGAAFLSRVHPDAAIISLGAGNEFGHPHKETLDRLATAGAVVFRTDLNGTVIVRTDGMKYSISTERAKPLAETGSAVTVPDIPSGIREFPTFDASPVGRELMNFSEYAIEKVKS
ncbi:MAG: MBL fold metallo-hydrolase, partial [Methanoregulaceae archaeon]|nr:MBL fold metallo-hydrolase [Methanoregulaceae archaeon]